jgi:predicted AlkP superfamily phosphohydrolase/phosphomutase
VSVSWRTQIDNDATPAARATDFSMTMIRPDAVAPFRAFRRTFSRIPVLVLAAALSACTPGPPPEPPPGSVVLIGLDGFEWKVALELLRENKLPAIASLMTDGAYGELRVTHPTLSPIIWTSIATGVDADRHGIHGFVKGKQTAKKADGRASTLYTSADRHVKALWNILTDADRTSYTIGWWMTFPAEPVRGVMVAQVNTITPKMRREGTGIWKGQLVENLEGQVFPAERSKDVLALVPEVEAQVSKLAEVMVRSTSGRLGKGPKAMLEQSLWAFRADAIYRRVGAMLLDEDKPFDLFSIYFGGADVIGHRFWRYAYPEYFKNKPRLVDRRAVGDLVRNYYVYLDSLVADLIARAPENATIVLVGDHGMLPIQTSKRFSEGKLSGGHLQGPAAFFVASGPPIRQPGRFPPPSELERKDLPDLGSILDIAPTILALRGLPVGRDMQGKPMKHIFDPAFLEAHPIRNVSTHTDSDWFDSRERAAGAELDPTERLEQLRTLGYLD